MEKVSVIGVGSIGIGTINHMISDKFSNVKYIAVYTGDMPLKPSNKIQIEDNICMVMYNHEGGNSLDVIGESTI